MRDKEGLKVGIVGATGAVGSQMLASLEESSLKVDQLCLAATSRSAGTVLSFRGEELRVEDIEGWDFQNLDVVLFSGGSTASQHYASKAIEAGAIVVDNSSFFRMRQEVPLVVPEVNAGELKRHQGLISNPNCAAAQLVVALAPLKPFGLKELSVTTFQAVSGAGKAGQEELLTQLQCWMLDKDLPQPEKFSRQIAFNVIPQIGDFDDSGYTGEESKLMEETKKILSLRDLKTHATCVRVPCHNGHSESVVVTLDEKTTLEQVTEALAKAKGTQFFSDATSFPTALDASGQDPVLIGRVHSVAGQPGKFHLWVVADNLRKGAATNAVQIVGALVEQGILG